MKSVYLALLHLPLAPFEVSTLERFFTDQGLQLGSQWGQARYYLESVEQVGAFAEAGLWLSSNDVDGEIRRGQLGMQTSLSLGSLSLVGNVGLVGYRGGKFLAIEMEHDVLAALADALHKGKTLGGSRPASYEHNEPETEFTDRFFVELARCVGSESFVVSWEVAIDVLGDLLLGYLSPEKGSELCTGSELRMLSCNGPCSMILSQMEPIAALREWKGLQYRATWFPGISPDPLSR